MGKTIYHNKVEGGTNVCIVPDHYDHSLKYIRETVREAKKWGLTVPKGDEITVEVMKSELHSNMLSIEFVSKTPLNSDVEGYSLCDLDIYPHCLNI